jgi:hypothetical protein
MGTEENLENLLDAYGCLQVKYFKLVEFVKYLHAGDSNYYRQTRQLLKEIGELDA